MCRDRAAPVPEIIEGTSEDAILQDDIVDRPPLRWWGRSGVTLLGDAVHACTPNLGQGACQALEDAVVLAHCLSGTLPIGAALRKYERLLHSAYHGNRSEVLANREHAATRLASVGIVS